MPFPAPDLATLISSAVAARLTPPLFVTRRDAADGEALVQLNLFLLSGRERPGAPV